MKKDKIKKILKKVLFIIFVVITCGCWCISISKCYHDKNLDHKIITHEINKAKINNADYISYDIGFNVDYQNYNTNKGIYEYYDAFDFWLVTLDTFDYYINVYQDNNNYNNIYGFGLSYNYEVFILDSPSITNSSLEDYIENESFYIDNLNINLNDYYNITNCNFIIDINPVNDFLYLDLVIKNDYNIYFEASYPFIDVGGYFNYYDITYSLDNSYVIPVKQLYYYLYSADNYFAGYDAGLNQGIDNVINSPNDYGLKSESQYLAYGESKYQEGYNKNASYSLEADGFIILFNTIMNAPFNIFSGLLEWEFMGINLFHLFSFIFTSVLVIWIIKLFV